MTFHAHLSAFSCDTCSESIECEGRSEFTGCLIYAKGQGWRTYKGPDNEWAHACPSCVEDHAKGKR